MNSPREFDYHATDAQGQAQSGAVSAADREAAMAELRDRGLQVLSLCPKGTKRFKAALHGNISPEDFISFNTHLAAIARSGAPLSEGLHSLAIDMRRGRFRAAIENVCSEVENGRSLSEALNESSQVFPELYVSLVRAGEVSGNLSGVLAMVAHQSKGMTNVRRRIVEALIYPGVLMVSAAAVYAFIALKIVPNFRQMFAEMGLPLPALTHLVFALSAPGIVYTVLGVLLLPTLFFLLGGSRTLIGRKILDTIVSFVPLARTIGLSYAYSRICAMMSMLLRGGVSLAEALGIVIGTVDSPKLKRALAGTEAGVTEGAAFSRALRETGGFPETLAWMASLGENTGDLPGAFSDLAELYESKASHAAAVLDIVLVPVVVLVTGMLVGLTVVALLSPLISLMSMMGG